MSFPDFFCLRSFKSKDLIASSSSAYSSFLTVCLSSYLVNLYYLDIPSSSLILAILSEISS